MEGFLRAKGEDKPYAAPHNNSILYKTQISPWSCITVMQHRHGRLRSLRRLRLKSSKTRSLCRGHPLFATVPEFSP